MSRLSLVSGSLLAFSLGCAFGAGEEKCAEADCAAETEIDTDTDADGDTDADADTDADTDTDADADADADTDADPTTVNDVQTGDVTGDVTLAGVVVTTPLDRDGELFFVQDRGGGSWSGVAVYLDGIAVTVGAGDLADVTGATQEYYGATEIVASDVVVAGMAATATEPFSSPPSDWEPWEGTLVALDGIAVTSDANEYGEADTDWGILVDDLLFAWQDEVVAGDVGTITGVVHYSFDAWRICPRDTADMTP
ncbi:MAG: hypothetical protein ACOZNI_21240 [Myxococcota bacterium]